MLINNLDEASNTYIIAEVAQNHDGSLGMAHAYIDAVARTGAHAIKFQTHIASEESTVHEPFRMKFSYCDNTRYDYWKRMEFSFEQWKGLYDHATSLGLDFLSSPFSIKALRMLDEIGVPAWKFGSGEVFNSVLLEKAIDTGKPIILSTGLSTYDDMNRQIERVKTNRNKLILMECTTAYPSKPEQIPIRLIHELKKRYQCLVGISDHSATIYPALSAISLGANCVEVHVTMSRDMFGPDVGASVTIDELKQIVDGAIFINKMMGCCFDKNDMSLERTELRNIFSKSIYLNQPLKKGHIIRENDIGIKKPYNAKGIKLEDYKKIIGKSLIEDMKMDEILTWEKIQ